jgi:hypothetical protein
MLTTYEIRILHQASQPPRILTSRHISDHAAVRRALALNPDGARMEVWRGTICVYSSIQAAA